LGMPKSESFGVPPRDFEGLRLPRPSCLLLLFGGGGGLYWGMGAGWGIGPIELIIAVVAIASLLNGYRGRRGPRLYIEGHSNRQGA
jgi:hypothetical protein